ncbi:GHKL domain-containing protein [Thiospirochaeta perfilievii]|uniref:histidine kinase n=1 Tax=Thiospirochaeta perfilievii TaxID=252967 RepID=A0A5C1QG19_9SPIO|nr:ATP-binding protein [Thiospirochaeta perfilievii]QEN06308.1 GHKL domain-containing protein [Thiospirochaeta perfilievii]
MRKFLERAINKVDRMNKAQLSSLLLTLKDELTLKEMVMGSLTQGILVSDHEDRVVYSNKAIDRLLPLRLGDNSELLVWSIIDNDDIYHFVKENLFEHNTVRDKIFVINSENNTLILSISLLPLASKGIIYGNVLIVNDVTESKEREIKLKRAESLASLTTMAAGVAHEIKNPLGSMSIHIQLMNKILNRDNFNKDDFSKYLDIISDEVERLNSIVVDYLFAVRPMNVELVDSDINVVIEELIEFTKYELEESHISVNLKLNKDIPKIYLDVKFIKQAFLNIIKNAIGAMESGGELTITTEEKDNFVQVSIRDNGIGIEESIQDKIFEPHFTTKETGSGLGLTLVYKIVKEHKGDISVSSKVGEGTCFNFVFPGLFEKEKLLLK